MSPYILTFIMFSLGLGTTITFASSHWLLAWMGLEVNTLAILPLMAQQHHPRAIEATTKYFIVQSAAAATMLFAGISNAWIGGQWHIQLSHYPVPTALAIIALCMKLGIAPFHAWLPEVLQGLNLSTGLIISTWQKLAPFILLTQLHPNCMGGYAFLGLCSVMIGGWGGLDQTQLRKVLAYSSISHLGWMIVIVQPMPALALLTLTTYIIMASTTFMLFMLTKSTTINMLANSWTKSPLTTAATPLILLSLGGLPPMTGFVPKWMIMQELILLDQTPTAVLIILAALISLYFYLRLSHLLSLLFPPNSPPGTITWRLPTLKSTIPFAISAVTSICLLPLAPTMIALLEL
uniref:NADH dehydrogenase subunit 2 n=1 Tax=Hemitaurichthys polylepis TaxID=109914 RepID=UPI00300256EE|nr:NADH dehydrogenase subunit 2 [Hemitaurichthys polylepis]